MSKTILSRISNVRVVEGIADAEAVQKLRKAVINRNRRVRYTVKKMTGAWNEENYLKLVRGQYVPLAVRLDFSKLKSKADL